MSAFWDMAKLNGLAGKVILVVAMLCAIGLGVNDVASGPVAATELAQTTSHHGCGMDCGETAGTQGDPCCVTSLCLALLPEAVVLSFPSRCSVQVRLVATTAELPIIDLLERPPKTA
ncbi:MAG: hypothetical protein ACOH2L_16715 [Devosia sp.]